MQETTFPVEILIHDDASTDATANIIREYEARYPQLIKPIYQTENQYSKAKKPGRINQSRAKGEFIAYCEGDDYWTSCAKLQCQVGLMLCYPGALMCGSRCFVIEEQEKTPYRIEPDIAGSVIKRLDASDYLRGRAFFRMHTRLVRTAVVQDYLEWSEDKNLGSGDWSLFLYVASKSVDIGQPVLFIDMPLATYREHKDGICTGGSQLERDLRSVRNLDHIIEIVNDIDIKLNLASIRKTYIWRLSRNLEQSPLARAEYCLEFLKTDYLDYGTWRCLLSCLLHHLGFRR